ncbi:MAG: VanZ family protein [Bacillaceae bacterium]|nr:VanZ family protein [Bacillaceae bacterium]
MSSVPGLRVLPVLKQLNAMLSRFDVYFIRVAEFIANRLPVNTNELSPLQTASNDFYAYAKANPVILEFILRKLAHIVVFFILTIVIFYLVNQYTKKSITAAMFAFIIATVLAALDEFHQSFVDGRVSSLIDVFIDLIGISTATFLILFAIFITKKWSKDDGPIH